MSDLKAHWSLCYNCLLLSDYEYCIVLYCRHASRVSFKWCGFGEPKRKVLFWLYILLKTIIMCGQNPLITGTPILYLDNPNNEREVIKKNESRK